MPSSRQANARVSFWRGVRRDYLLRRCWVLKFLGNKRERQLLRSLFSDPLLEGHSVDRDSFFCGDKHRVGSPLGEPSENPVEPLQTTAEPRRAPLRDTPRISRGNLLSEGLSERFCGGPTGFPMVLPVVTLCV